MIRHSAATRRGRAGGSASERDDVMGSGPRVPSGGRDAPDCMENFGAKRYIREGKEDPHTNDGREECLSSGWRGRGRGRELRVCSGGSPVCRPAVEVRIEGDPRVVGDDIQCHPTGAATDDPGISDDFGGRNSGHSSCAGRSAHGSRGEAAAGGMHSKIVIQRGRK